MSREGLHAAELVKVGSRIRERYLLKIPTTMAPEPLLYELRGRLAPDSARVSSYRDAQPQLKQSLEQLTRYLGLIGLTALFVGGLGVATSVHAFVREKLNTIAILKTIGAESPTIIRTYGLQAMILGLVGSLVGLMHRCAAPPRTPVDDCGLDGIGSSRPIGIRDEWDGACPRSSCKGGGTGHAVHAALCTVAAVDDP